MKDYVLCVCVCVCVCVSVTVFNVTSYLFHRKLGDYESLGVSGWEVICNELFDMLKCI